MSEYRQNAIIDKPDADGTVLAVAQSACAHEVLAKALAAGSREVHVVVKEPGMVPVRPATEGARRHLEVWAFAYTEDGS